MGKYVATHYMLQISNPINKHFSTIHTFSFTLSVQDASQAQISDNIKLIMSLNYYTSLFHIPVYIGAVRYSDTVARSPPPVIYQEV